MTKPFKISGGSIGGGSKQGATTVVSTKDNRVVEYEAPSGPDPFEWSATFPYPAESTTELIQYLGIDGSVSVNIGEDKSHLWQADAIPCTDIGSLGSSAHALTGSGSPVLTTNSNYGLGVRNVIEYDPHTDRMAAVPSGRIPEQMDGTKSLIVGGIMHWDSFPGGDVTRHVITQYRPSVNKGWVVESNNSGGNTQKLRFVTIQSGATVHDIWTTNIVSFGTPFAFIANIDVAAGKIKIMTSESGSYAEDTWVDSGDYDAVLEGLTVGDGTFATQGGFVGQWAQMFSFEYSGSLDAEISEDNMTQFLKYCDGFLTV